MRDGTRHRSRTTLATRQQWMAALRFAPKRRTVQAIQKAVPPELQKTVARSTEGKYGDASARRGLRIKLAAAQQHLSMRDYVEHILLAAVPLLPATERLQQRRPMSPEVMR
jgi:hypothetical protein